MSGKLEEILGSTFSLRENEGEDKVVSLEEAVRGNVKPGMAVHAGTEANALLREVLRQHWGTRPDFTLIMTVITGNYASSLIHGGLVKKFVFSNFSDMYPAPSPNPVIQRAFREKRMEFENWSTLSFVLRLMAGALGLGFIPTRSMVGSTVAEENKDSFKVMEDPFGSGKTLGLLKALNPDISLMHGWAADRYGNTIMPPFTNSSAWGPKASVNGVVVTVERLVSTSFIREHSRFVRIPGYLVKAVSVVPFGGHPQSMSSHGLKEFEAYGLDSDFMVDMRKASEDPAAFDAWIKEWVLDCREQNRYLAKLGSPRTRHLKGKAREDFWRHELVPLLGAISTSLEFTPSEMMVVAACRKIKEAVRNKSYRILFAGIGTSGIPGWLAYYELQREGYQVEIIPAGIGSAPRPGDPYQNNMANIPTAKMLPEEILDVHGVCATGEHNRCLGIMGAGQIDKYGNINSSKISDDLYLAGIAGGNDMASASQEVLAVAPQSRRRLVEKVSYLSQPGERVRTLVSTMGVLEKLEEDREFTLTQYFPNLEGRIPEEKIEKIKERCGWELKVSPEVKETPSPTEEELLTVRLFDPKGHFIGR